VQSPFIHFVDSRKESTFSLFALLLYWKKKIKPMI